MVGSLHHQPYGHIRYVKSVVITHNINKNNKFGTLALKNLVKHVREEVKKINSIRPVIKTNLPPPSRNWDIISQKFPYANDWFQKNCIKSVQFIEMET